MAKLVWKKLLIFTVLLALAVKPCPMRPADEQSGGSGQVCGVELSSPSFNILHFTDTSELERSPPFVYQYLRRKSATTLPLSSGDIFSPSFLSSLHQGAQFASLLARLELPFASIANHDMDFGEEQFKKNTAALKTIWMAGNLKRKGTNINIGEAAESGTKTINGIKICVFGLVDDGFISGTQTLSSNDYDYEPFLDASRRISVKLRQDGCEFIVLNSAMSLNKDRVVLEDSQSDINLIVSGDNHIYHLERHNNRLLIKSGYNFDYFSNIKVKLQNTPYASQTQNSATDSNYKFTLDVTPENLQAEPNQTFYFSLATSGGKYFNLEVEKVAVKEDGPKDWVIEKYINDNYSTDFANNNNPMFKVKNNLDIRSKTISNTESAAGNFFADLMRAYFGYDISVLVAGFMRAEKVYFANKIVREYNIKNLFSLKGGAFMKLLTVPGSGVAALIETATQAMKLGGFETIYFSGITLTYNPALYPSSIVIANSLKVEDKALAATSIYNIVMPGLTEDQKKLFPILAAVTFTDPPGSPIYLTDIVKDFAQAANGNKTEFDLFKANYSTTTIDNLVDAFEATGSKAEATLTQTLITNSGVAEALKALNAAAIKRLKYYSLSDSIETVEGRDIFVIDPQVSSRISNIV